MMPNHKNEVIRLEFCNAYIIAGLCICRDLAADLPAEGGCSSSRRARHHALRVHRFGDCALLRHASQRPTAADGLAASQRPSTQFHKGNEIPGFNMTTRRWASAAFSTSQEIINYRLKRMMLQYVI